MRFVRIAPINSGPGISFSRNVICKGLLTYQEFAVAYDQMGYTYGTGVSNAMKNLGYDAAEIVYDCEIMQKTWANEHSTQFREESWKTDILLAQIRYLQPDILLFQGSDPVFSSTNRRKWKKKFPSIQVLLLHKGNISPVHEMKGFDMVFSAYPRLHKRNTDAGLPSFLLYHGFDHRRLLQLQQWADQYDCTFSGSSGYGISEHRIRYQMLDELFSKTPLRGWLAEEVPKPLPVSSSLWRWKSSLISRSIDKIRKFGAVNLVKQFSTTLSERIHSNLCECKGVAVQDCQMREPDMMLKQRYPDKIQPAVHGITMLNLLHNSKTSLQIGGDAQIYKQNGSMRQFEATGSGSVLLMDHGENVEELFIPDKEILTYSSVHDCMEKMQYLSDNPDEQKKIAIAGQKRTLQDHTIEQRCKAIDLLINELL